MFIMMLSMTILLLFFSFMMFMLSIYLKIYELMFLYIFNLHNLNIFSIEYVLLVDWISMMFLSLVLFISSMVILYSISYISYKKKRYFYLLMIFIISMCLMILSMYNMVSLFIGWDLLGLSSYCLVIFYSNYLSYKSGIMTILMNRFGDVMLLMLIGLLYLNGSLNLINYNNLHMMIYILLFIAALTKSAQLPFSSWLPAAMAAPTPISSLVHSSTLVTAGVYLLIRFNLMNQVNIFLMIISMLTMFVAGLAANLEYDFKKIIALSTLSQLGLMFTILSLGFSFISFFHLLTHAMFKSMLFMCAGILIHGMNDIQDIRFYGNFYKITPFVCLCFNFASMSLSGLPFLSGFYSKDKILELFFMSNLNFFLIILLIFSTILTVSYSFRLFMYMYNNNKMLGSLNMLEENLLMNFSMLLLMFLTLMGGLMLNYIFMMSMNLIILYFYFKMLILSFISIGIILGYFMYNSIMLNKIKVFFYNLVMMNLLWSYMSIFPLKMSSFMLLEVEKGLLEMFIGRFDSFNIFYYYKKNVLMSWSSIMIFMKSVFIMMLLILMFN